MNQFTKEQIERAYDLLPKETQDVLFGPTIEGVVQKIGQESGLNEKQLVLLNGLVNFTIMGLIKKEDLSSEILKSLTASAEETSKKISAKIDSEILASTLGAVAAKPVLVPQNLPVSETEATPVVVVPPEPVKQSFVPNNEARSSFEEKMGQAFVKTSTDINAGSGTGSTARVDPYREPIG